MKIAIIEDEPLAANNLKKLVKVYDSTFKILPIADSVDQAVTLLSEVEPDLIFLDIELADGSSFEIFKQIKISAPIIFTTAYDHYSIKAFEVNSIAYLLKPINAEKLEDAFSNLERMKKAFDPKKFNLALSELNQTSYKSNFLVKRGNKLIPIEVDQIAYFVASDKWVYLVTHDNEKFIVNYNLSELSELINPQNFFRVNRQYLVSKKAINWLEPYFKGQVCVSLKPETEVQVVSRKVTPELKEWLTN